MHDSIILRDLLILFATAAASVLVMRPLKLPPVVGYLIAGVLAGPHGFHLLQNVAHVRELAEIGVVLLLFTIGLELSPTRLWELRREALLGGGLQVVLTAVAGFVAASAVGLPIPTAVTAGFVVSLSSTAIILRLLSEKGRLDTPYGRICLAVLLFQDIMVVPITLAVPLLAGFTGGGLQIGLAGLKAVVLVVGVLLVSKRLVPLVLDRVIHPRNRELFLLVIGVIVFGTAWLTMQARLSPALGAFLAGLVMSESEHKVSALSETSPFRDLFLAIFFISIGMFLDLEVLIHSPWIPILLALAIYTLKSLLILGIIGLLGYGGIIALRSSVYLGQIGEFSFVIILIGSQYGLLGEALVQQLVGAAALTMIATPMMITGIDRFAVWRQTRYNGKKEEVEVPPPDDSMEPHVVIVGFGHGGRSVAKVLREIGIPYKVVEMNPVTVKREKQAGERIMLGDATRQEVWRHIELHRARAVVIAINDPDSLRAMILNFRRERENLYIIARIRYVSEINTVLELGADDVVSEEMEAAVYIVQRLLHRLGLPDSVARRYLEGFHGVGAAGPGRIPRTLHLEEMLGGLEVITQSVEASDGAVGRSLVDINIRRETGANVISVLRGDKPLLDPSHTKLQAGDVLVLSGNVVEIDSAMQLLKKQV